MAHSQQRAVLADEFHLFVREGEIEGDKSSLGEVVAVGERGVAGREVGAVGEDGVRVGVELSQQMEQHLRLGGSERPEGGEEEFVGVGEGEEDGLLIGLCLRVPHLSLLTQ